MPQAEGFTTQTPACNLLLYNELQLCAEYVIQQSSNSVKLFDPDD